MALGQLRLLYRRNTRSFARDIGLEPRTPPIESPQSNGMAEAFVRMIKCNYVRVDPRPNAESVMRPHKALGYRSQVDSLQPTKDIDRVRSFGGYNSATFLKPDGNRSNNAALRYTESTILERHSNAHAALSSSAIRLPADANVGLCCAGRQQGGNQQ
jgi:hypothetical protein